MIGLHMVSAYSNMESVIALNVETISFFRLAYLIEVSAFKMLNIQFALNHSNSQVLRKC